MKKEFLNVQSVEMSGAFLLARLDLKSVQIVKAKIFTEWIHPEGDVWDEEWDKTEGRGEWDCVVENEFKIKKRG
ncbi:MAG: hypothetical protein ACUVRY_03025 [Thermoanaerobaculaceae bacterium]